MVNKKVDIKKELDELVGEVFRLMDVDAAAHVEIDESGEEMVAKVSVDSDEDTGLLIGRRGDTLSALQSFLAMAMKQKTGDWIRVVVNIGDWRDKQEERLVSLAGQAAERAKSTGEPQHLYNLLPAQRRIIHLELSKDKEIETDSLGEGEERYLIIKPKSLPAKSS